MDVFPRYGNGLAALVGHEVEFVTQDMDDPGFNRSVQETPVIASGEAFRPSIPGGPRRLHRLSSRLRDAART